MTWLEYIMIYGIIFLYGICFWSFMSSFIYRLSLITKWNLEDYINNFKWRSFCPTCKHQLGVKDLFPFFSYIFSWGKCNYCSNKIGIQYPIYEIVMWIGFIITIFVFYNKVLPITNWLLILQMISSLWITFFFLCFLFSLKYDIKTIKRTFIISFSFIFLFFITYSLLLSPVTEYIKSIYT